MLFRLSILLMALYSLVGCTKTTLSTYAPVTRRQSSTGIAVHVAPIEDARNKKAMIGHRVIDIIPILHKSPTDFDQWVQHALISELRQAGYQIANDAPYHIQGKIIESYAKTFTATVALELTCMKGDQALFVRTYECKGNYNSLLPGDHLAASYQKILSDFLIDLKENL